MTKISALSSLAGGSVDAANDVLAIVDVSATQTKKITVADLLGLVTDITGLLDFKGSTDCSANPNYPAGSKGDFYLVSVAGKIGGASGIVVEAGDTYFAIADNAGGTQASVGASWTVIQGNITSYMPKTGGVFTGDIEVPAEVYGSGWNASNEAPTKNDVYDKIEAVIASGGGGITALTGDVTASGAGSVSATIAADAVTYAKMQNVSATSRILGRKTAGAGDVEELTASDVRTLAGLVIGTDVQAYDPDLSTYAGITPSANVQSVLGAANYAAIRALLGLVIGTDIPARNPSIQSVASSATVTPTFADDQVNITAQAAGLTLANPTGTAVDGWGIAIRIKDNGTARSLTFGSQYRALGVTLPTTTVISKTLYLGMIFNNADTKWDVVAVAQEA